MWKYADKKICNDFLLSLNLIDNKKDNEIIKEIYAISNKTENNYTIFRITKHSGGYRTIYEPNSVLKHIQKQILKNVLYTRSISKYAKAYSKGTSLLDNALPHVGKDIILKLDIKSFFDSITFSNIYKSCFGLEYFPKQIGMLLTSLVTYNDFLPQGAPTSSYISNLVMKDYDEEIGKWCNEKNIEYTRYSDDMTFSGDFDPSEVIKIVRKYLYKLGLKINNKKIHVIKNCYCQNVTGVVVNEKLQVSSKYRKRIRQEIYYIKKYGIDSHLKRINMKDKNKYLKSLYGKILFVLQINNNDKEFIEYKKYILKII